MPNNADRADRAAAAIAAYCDHSGDRPDESHFRDLLCDLMHLAARDGAGDGGDTGGGDVARLDFDQALVMARGSFEFEAVDDGAEYGDGEADDDETAPRYEVRQDDDVNGWGVFDTHAPESEGDGFLFSFDSESEAKMCALARNLAAE